MKKNTLPISLGLILISANLFAQGVVSTSSSSAFSAAFPDYTTLTFSGIAPFDSYTEYTDWASGGVSFHDGDHLYIVNNNWSTSGSGLGFQWICGGSTADLTMSPSTGVGWGGFAMSTFNGASVIVDVMLSDGSDHQFNIPGNNVVGGPLTFSGFECTGSQTISQVLFKGANGGGPYIESVFTGVTPVPEPSVITLMGTGGCLAVFACRRRK